MVGLNSCSIVPLTCTSANVAVTRHSGIPAVLYFPGILRTGPQLAESVALRESFAAKVYSALGIGTRACHGAVARSGVSEVSDGGPTCIGKAALASKFFILACFAEHDSSA